jgi:hypothetical protein
MENQVRRLDKRTITISSIPIKNLHRIPDRRDAVRANLLQQDGRGYKRLDAVVTITTVADAITVNFEDDVATAIFIFETCWVD